MKIFKTPEELKIWRSSVKGSVGFVPTMGALHEGHAQLLRQARKENDLVLLSIFVNPTQFNNPDDLKNYPKTWDQDLAIATDCGVNGIFFPTPESMYPDQYRYSVNENSFSLILCGAHRPGHFQGMLTVVMKLLNLANADKAYFGEKDYQQLKLIREMVSSFFMKTTIVPAPTVRESDGLAMSSRNVRLTAEERKLAPEIFKTITTSKNESEATERLTAKGFKVEYVKDIDGRRFVAAHLGAVRLIDNVDI